MTSEEGQMFICRGGREFSSSPLCPYRLSGPFGLLPIAHCMGKRNIVKLTAHLQSNRR